MKLLSDRIQIQNGNRGHTILLLEEIRGKLTK